MKKGNIHFKIIFRVLGSLLFIEAFFLILSLIVSLIYNEYDKIAFLITIGVALFFGILSRILTRNSKNEIGKREGFILLFTIIVASVLYFTPNTAFEKAFRDAIFQVISLITTTGYATADFLKWFPFLITLLFIAMFFGGSASSTGGGIKFMRIVLLMKNSVAEFKRLIHPQAIIPVKFNHNTVKPQIITNILAFIVLYVSIFVFGTIVMSAIGLDLETAMGAVITSLGNVGHGLGDLVPAGNFHNVPTIGKWFLSFLMLVGGLELFTVLILSSPSFWKK